VWLDFDCAECHSALLARGYPSTEEPERTKLAESFQRLLTYAEAYYTRNGPRSREGHAALHAAFLGANKRLANRAQMNAFLAGIADMPDSSTTADSIRKPFSR
jgi:hypothetical protein